MEQERAVGEAAQPPVVVGLFTRLDQVRQIGRNRQRRFQIPLGVVGVVMSILSVVGGLAGRHTVMGGLGMALGPFLLLLCVLPTDPRMIILAILCVIGCIMAANFLHVIATGQLVPQQQRYCPAPVSEVTCALFAAANWYAIAILCLHGFYAGYLLLALVSSTLRVSWLPWRPARASLDSLWRLLGILFVCYTPVWITFTFVELREPSAALHYRNELEAELPSHDRLAIRALISLELFGLGCLALWRRLRAVVQSRLASMGAGVAAAAGISELLGYAPTKDLIEFAQLTLRSVRLDQVEMRHLETFRSPSEAYALSTPATLGSIDAFLSHSWHDPLREKWAVLQAWRERFVRDNGREPVVWLDRACLNPALGSAQLPALPVYCAACDKLVALRGPTYLNRLWCIIEIYCFFEMMQGGDASPRIEILRLPSAPPYTSEGIRVDSAGDTSSSNVGVRSRRESTLPFQRFDVQQARCAIAQDEERMLAVIECCGSGFEFFNAWMHNLLHEHSADDEHKETQPSVTTPFHRLRHGRGTFKRGHVVRPWEPPSQVQVPAAANLATELFALT